MLLTIAVFTFGMLFGIYLDSIHPKCPMCFFGTHEYQMVWKKETTCKFNAYAWDEPGAIYIELCKHCHKHRVWISNGLERRPYDENLLHQGMEKNNP